MGVKVTFQIGGRRGLVRNSDSESQSDFVNALGKEVVKKAADNIGVDVRRLENVLQLRVKRSLENAMNVAVNNLMGTKSAMSTRLPNQAKELKARTKAPPTKIFFDLGDNELPSVNPSKKSINEMVNSSYVEWSALSQRTIIKKSEGGKAGKGTTPREEARRYFIHTGALKKELQGIAKSITTKTGTVKIDYIKEDAKTFSVYRGRAKKVKVGRMRIRFLPKLQIKNLGGFLSGDPADDFDPRMLFERSLGISEGSLEKLQGRGLAHRPLLQPIFSFWALNRIPKLVASSIASSFLTQRIDAGGFSGDFSMGTK